MACHTGRCVEGEQEVAFKSSSSGRQIQSFTVPNSAKTGITKMRISMKKGGPGQTSCDVFSRGEVEDYSVNITAKPQGSFVSNKISTIDKNVTALSINPILQQTI